MQLKTLACSALSVAALAITACGPAKDPAADITAAAPAGKINGQSWTMTKAVVRMNSDQTMDVRLFGEDVADCSLSPPQGSTTPYVMFGLPAKTGERELKFSFDFSDPTNQTVTFFVPSTNTNEVSIDGIINVTELTDTSVTIGLNAKMDGNSPDVVNGTFTATLCK